MTHTASGYSMAEWNHLTSQPQGGQATSHSLLAQASPTKHQGK